MRKHVRWTPLRQGAPARLYDRMSHSSHHMHNSSHHWSSTPTLSSSTTEATAGSVHEQRGAQQVQAHSTAADPLTSDAGDSTSSDELAGSAVERSVTANLPTEYGSFQMMLFRSGDSREETRHPLLLVVPSPILRDCL